MSTTYDLILKAQDLCTDVGMQLDLKSEEEAAAINQLRSILTQLQYREEITRNVCGRMDPATVLFVESRVRELQSF
jgi:hypothetical protein